MVIYSSCRELGAGLPLGGVGAGKVEIDPKGKMRNLTIFNNWSRPLPQARGFHLFLNSGSRGTFLECGVPVHGMESNSSPFLYEGRYPLLTLSTLGTEVKLTAFTALVKGNIQDSSLPAFGLKVDAPRSVRMAVSFPNLVGTSPVGRKNSKVEGGFRLENELSTSQDPAAGNITVVADSPSRVIHQYSVNRSPREALREGKFKEGPEEPSVWRSLISGQDFPSLDRPARSFWDDFAGLVEVEGEARIVVAWYFNNPWIYFPYRHYYGNFFRDSTEVARHFLDQFDLLLKASSSFRPTDPTIPQWVNDAADNGAYVLSTNTWLDERGRFSMFEAPENFPAQGTIAGWTYEAGSIPVLLNFPSLERSFLLNLASHLSADGRVPHDLGLWSLDLPMEGTTSPPTWKDLEPTFVLLLYRYYLTTGELPQELAEALRKVVATILKRGVPRLEGSGDTAFDATPVEGLDSYTLTLTLASLRAAERLLGGEFVEPVRELASEVERALWATFNGEYFKAWESPDVGDALFLGQLAGPWWCSLLGLECFDEEEVRSILRRACEINGRASSICSPNLASNRPLKLSPQTASSWPRLVYSMAWLGLRYDVPCVLELAKREWDYMVSRGLVWNQPSRIDAVTGVPDVYLDHYVGSPALWSIDLGKFIEGKVKGNQIP
ncbi:GH116 family glycosyl hydrolase [Sulfodiicoccus acidiphilus]|nr:GH116 family glycosyl hydrolase [Sulfodiicoccus acidiphilus]